MSIWSNTSIVTPISNETHDARIFNLTGVHVTIAQAAYIEARSIKAKSRYQ